MFIPESVAPLVGYFNIKQTLVAMGATPTKLCGGDAERVLLIITPQAAGAVRISAQSTGAAAANGIVAAGNANLVLDFRTFGALISGEIWGFGNPASNTTVTEISYRPAPGN